MGLLADYQDRIVLDHSQMRIVMLALCSNIFTGLTEFLYVVVNTECLSMAIFPNNFSEFCVLPKMCNFPLWNSWKFGNLQSPCEPSMDNCLVTWSLSLSLQLLNPIKTEAEDGGVGGGGSQLSESAQCSSYR